MDDLVDQAVALMGRASDSFTTVQGTLRLRRNAEAAVAAVRRRKRVGRALPPVEIIATDEMRARWPERYRPLPDEVDGRLWVRHPWTVRVEGHIGWGQHPWGPQRWTGVEIHDRHRSWTWDLKEGKFGPPSGFGGRPPGPIELFDPRRVLRYWSLSAVGRGSVADRATVRVRAEPNPPDQEHLTIDMSNTLSWIERGADGWELDVDAERGLILRFTATLDHAPIFTVEFLTITFDEPIADDVFTFVDCAGQEEPPLWHHRDLSLPPRARCICVPRRADFRRPSRRWVTPMDRGPIQ
jgi:hypothetical protein